LPSQQQRMVSIRGGGGAFTKKIFTPVGCLRDHVTIMLHIPRILLAYVGPFAIAPDTNEAIMLAVNSENSCPWCTSLHGELGRMAGLGDKATAINTAKSLADVKKASGDSKEAAFARLFAECDGRGAAVQAAFAELKASIGPNKAASVKALCWFLHWGSICGNTIGAFIKGRLVGRPKCGSSWLSVDPLYELAFSLYYGVCYTLVTVTSALLKVFPSGGFGVVNSLMGVVLTCVASLWIVPMGMLGIATLPLRIFRSKDAKSTY
jgi:AhpD family alkylhydroperoxidase